MRLSACPGILISAAGLARQKQHTEAARTSSAALDPHLCRCGIHNRVGGRGAERPVRSSQPRNQLDPDRDFQHAAAKPDRQPDPVRSGWRSWNRAASASAPASRNRPGHPDRTPPRSPQKNWMCGPTRSISCRRNRHQPGRSFTSAAIRSRSAGRRSAWSAPSALAVFLDRVAETLRCPPGELSIKDGKFLRARPRDRTATTVDGGRDRTRAPGHRHRTVKRPSDLQGRRQASAAPRSAAKIKGTGFIHDIARTTCCTPVYCASPGAARTLWRSTKRDPQGREAND